MQGTQETIWRKILPSILEAKRRQSQFANRHRWWVESLCSAL